MTVCASATITGSARVGNAWLMYTVGGKTSPRRGVRRRRRLIWIAIFLARVERDAGQSRRALELWREARKVLLDDRATLAQLKVDDFNDYLELLCELADGGAAADRAELIDEASLISQLGQTPAAGRAITQVASPAGRE